MFIDLRMISLDILRKSQLKEHLYHQISQGEVISL